MKRILFIILLLFSVTPLFACFSDNSIEESIFAFDTIIEVKIRAPKEKINEHYEKVCDIFYYYDDISNAYIDNGKANVCRINESDDFIEVDSELVELLKFSLSMMEKTNGHFNPLIGNLSNYYKRLIDSGETSIDQEYVLAELANMNASRIVFDGNRVKIEGKAKIDLGGVAKGYALSKVREYLQENNIHYYLINAGSSSLSIGNKSGEYFVVGIKYDSNNILYIKDLELGCASINEQYLKGDERLIHHIVNPLTGYPDTLHTSVYLIGEDSGLIDAFATAFISMELSEIKKLCEENDLEYIIYNEDEVFKSNEGHYYGKD